MKIIFVTYSNDLMSRSRMLCAESARKHGADMVFEYEPHNIDEWFRKMNYETLAAEKGAGFWLWKPYVVWRALQHCEDGDTLVYIDAGCEIINNLQHIVDAMNQNNEDVFLFTNGLTHAEWCKMDIMAAMLPPNHGGQDSSIFDCRDQTQVQASAMFFRVNTYTRNFIKEWLLWAQMPGFITDEPSKIPNVPTFAEHRYDQALITNLAKRENLTLHWWFDAKWFLSQRYRWPNDTYPAIVLHHRKRNSDY